MLDIVSVPLVRPEPRDFQSENWLLNPRYYWKKKGRAGWSELLRLEQRPSALWINGSSTYHGIDNRIPVERAITLSDSLKLIRVTALTLQVCVPGRYFGDSRVRLNAYFSYASHTYIMSVTDPAYEGEYLVKPEGDYELGESFLTISLGEPHDGYVYKLVAAIIERAKI